MIRRVVSLIVTLLASSIGYFCLWSGGIELMRIAGTYGAQKSPDTGAILLVLLGMAMLALASITVAFSSLGVIIVGIAHIVIGLISVLSPMQSNLGDAPLTYQWANSLFGRNEVILYGFYAAVPTGVVLVVGIILLVAGLTARRRRVQPQGTARMVSVLVAVFLGFGGLLLVLTQGAIIYIAQLRRISWDVDMVVVGLLILGVLLVAAATASMYWSSCGAVMFGVILIVYQLIALFQSRPIGIAELSSISRELGQTVEMWSMNGNIGLVGIVIFAAAIGSRIRRRKYSSPHLPSPQGSFVY